MIKKLIKNILPSFFFAVGFISQLIALLLYFVSRAATKAAIRTTTDDARLISKLVEGCLRKVAVCPKKT